MAQTRLGEVPETLDGVVVIHDLGEAFLGNIRRRVAGRPKKGGRKRFETEWREPKVLTLYVLGEDGKRDRSVPSVIDGTLGDADAVFDLLRYHLLRMGAHRASHVTLVADAAKWIWRRRSQELRKALRRLQFGEGATERGRGKVAPASDRTVRRPNVAAASGIETSLSGSWSRYIVASLSQG